MKPSDYQRAIEWLQKQPTTEETQLLLLAASDLVFKVWRMQESQRNFPTGNVIPLKRKR